MHCKRYPRLKNLYFTEESTLGAGIRDADIAEAGHPEDADPGVDEGALDLLLKGGEVDLEHDKTDLAMN